MTHDALLVDLDGTVYRGPVAIDGAVASLEAARGRGIALAYVTNNASRAPQQVADHLAELGLTVDVDDVVTSAQAGAAVLTEHCRPGSRVLVVGTESLADEVRAVGLEPVRSAADEPVAVIQGHSPDTGWAELAEATVVLRGGATWVACNVDRTLPHERGLLPGNGAMVAALRAASDREPIVAGKPAAPLMRQSTERVGSRCPLVVGDRLDTDVAGAHEIGADSLLVLTGVSTATDLLVAPPALRPTHVAADLRVLDDDGGAALEVARVVDGETWDVDVAHGDDGLLLVLRGTGDVLSGLRSLCAAAWRAAGDDAVRSVSVRPDGAGADDVIAGFDLPRA